MATRATTQNTTATVSPHLRLSPFEFYIAAISVAGFSYLVIIIIVRKLILNRRVITALPPLPRKMGLASEAIEALPTMLYSEARKLASGGEWLACAICLCEFEDDDELRLLPACCHVFHQDCIDKWLANHVTCPICRAELSTPAAASGGEDDSAGRQPEIINSEQEEIDLVRISSLRRAVRGVLDDHQPNGGRVLILRRSRSDGGVYGRTEVALMELAAGDTDRFTLRLPESVMKDVLLAAGDLESLPRSRSAVPTPRIPTP